MNGMCNFIFDVLDCGEFFVDVVVEVQRLGFVEVDFSMDLDGDDVVDKLVIICYYVFGIMFDVCDISWESLFDLFFECIVVVCEVGLVFKQVGCCVVDNIGGVDVWVELCVLL